MEFDSTFETFNHSESFSYDEYRDGDYTVPKNKIYKHNQYKKMEIQKSRKIVG